MRGRRDASTKSHVAGMRTMGAQDILARLADKVPDDPNGFRVSASAARVGAGISEIAKGIAATPHARSVPTEVAVKIRNFTAINWTVGLPLSESIQSVALALMGLGISPKDVTALFQWFVWGQVSVVMSAVQPGVAAAYSSSVLETAEQIASKQLGMAGLSQNIVELLAMKGVSAGPSQGGPVAASPSVGLNPGGSKLNEEDNLLTRGAYGLGRTVMGVSAGVNSWHDDREVTHSTKESIGVPGVAKVDTSTTTTKGPVVVPK